MTYRVACCVWKSETESIRCDSSRGKQAGTQTGLTRNGRIWNRYTRSFHPKKKAAGISNCRCFVFNKNKMQAPLCTTYLLRVEDEYSCVMSRYGRNTRTYGTFHGRWFRNRPKQGGRFGFRIDRRNIIILCKSFWTRNQKKSINVKRPGSFPRRSKTKSHIPGTWYGTVARLMRGVVLWDYE